MSLKHVLNSLTIVFIIRLDTINRLENLICVLNYIQRYFSAKIIILEIFSYNNHILEKLLDDSISYFFQIDSDPILFRTKYLNQALSFVITPHVAIIDSDVIIHPNQLIKGIEFLRKDETDFVYPYDKQFLDTSPILRKLYLIEGNLDILFKNIGKMKEMYTPNPRGGVFLANFQAYRSSGFENENFYGWGLEDGERFYRWEKLEYRIKRVPGPLFHLSHGRGINSNFHDVDQHFNKKRELLEWLFDNLKYIASKK
jgi:predicted glycosyltransferase involved in capsule biosynthesis